MQGYVAVSYGMLDPASEYFSPMFAASLSVSMCTAAAALIGVDTAHLADSGTGKAVRPAHLAAMAVFRVAETLSTVFSKALFACAFKGWAVRGPGGADSPGRRGSEGRK